MRTFLLSLAALGLAGYFAYLSGQLSSARQGNDLTLASGGTLYCGGSYRYDGSDASSALRSSVHWNLRNYNEDADITIERIQIFQSDGAILFDSDVSSTPSARFDRLGAADPVLDSRQTAQYRADELVNDGVLRVLTNNQQPVQFVVTWSAQKPVLRLDGSQIRRQFDDNEIEKSRHQYDCRHTSASGGLLGRLIELSLR